MTHHTDGGAPGMPSPDRAHRNTGVKSPKSTKPTAVAGARAAVSGTSFVLDVHVTSPLV
jgi:hypothetical protein